MPRTAKQTVDITALLKGILNGYPGNSAILREYLQNSDDAKATKQIFILDVRRHPTTTLLDPILADTQGPALIAWNDQILSDRDWVALRKIHSSSKSSDETQTGKNGLGFRASYHLTENPQILSGQTLLILDPHEEFHDHAGGAKFDIVKEGPRYADQLRSFDSIVKEPFKEFQSTVFRLPFRTQEQAERSRIKKTPTSIAEMDELLTNFAQELEEVILFLKHITSIEIRRIDADGRERLIGSVTIDPRPDASLETFTRRITVDIAGEEQRSRLWKYYHHKVDRVDAAAILSQRLGYDIGDFLIADKLTADVELALPLDLTSISGRLYTLLPLPIRTGFPVHLNAAFSLTPDRQSLKNIEEAGSAQARERCLIEWNRTIFNDFGVKAWARLLSDLAGDIDDVWSAWPPEATDRNSYWVSLVPSIIEEAKTLKIFPIISSSGRPPLVSLTDQSLLLAPQNSPVSLDSLAKMGLFIIQPPSYIFKILTSSSFRNFFIKLSPASLYEQLRDGYASNPTVPADSAADIENITDYLVFWGEPVKKPAFDRLIDLPWFTLVDGSPTCLLRQSALTKPFIVPSNEHEAVLFDTPGVVLAWPCISDNLRNALSTARARGMLNVATVSPASILRLVKDRFSSQGGGEEIKGSDADIGWLLHFWKWISDWKRAESGQLARGLSGLYILPTAHGTLRRWSSWSILLVSDPTSDLLDAWRELGISILHTDLASSGIFQVLQDHKIGMLPSVPSYIFFLAQNYHCDEPSSVTPASRNALRASIQPTLPLMGSGPPGSLSPAERKRISCLPIFSARPGNGEPPSFHPISGDRRYVKVNDDFPLPVLPGTRLYIDMTDPLTDSLVRLVDVSPSILTEHELLMLAVNHSSLQPANLMEIFVERILNSLLTFRPAFCEKLKDLAFISVEGQTQPVAPRDLIDPNSTLAELYRGETGKFPGGRFSMGRHLMMMQSQGFFRSKLDPEIIAERLGYLASSPNDRKMIVFLHLLNNFWDESFAETIIAHREVGWLPSSNSPSKCRDGKGSPHEHYLYDHVFTIHDWAVSSPGLRKALGWSDVVPFEVLAKQFSFTVRDPRRDRTEQLKYLISYFANYSTLSSLHFDQLREIVSDMPWVPVNNREQPLSVSQYATLSATSLGYPFYQAQQASELQHHDFLSKMGCTDRPSIDTLAAELRKALSPESWSVSTAISFLQEIADYHQESIPARSDILIPTNSKEARLLADVYYQDMMSDYILEIEKSAAHSELSKGLAEKLGITLMSSLQLGDDDDEDEPQMSEDLIGRIRGFLRENDIRFALNEFLANADDAGAKQFSMKLVQPGNYPAASTIKVVSPDFQKLEKFSRVIMWNDSVFTQDDFKGVRRVGQGGKRDRGNTHGRHGLGALSLYYFTDVPMIISGEYILILDPSSRYLPPRRGQKRTSLFRKLSAFTRQFPDQLQSLHGKFGFNLGQLTYDGTLFLLPLSSTIYEQELPDCRDLLYRTYRDLAANAFFFTGLLNIKFEDDSRTLWHMSVINRTKPLPLTGSFTRHLLRFTRDGITEEWMIATSDKSPIPHSQATIALELKFPPNSPMPVQLAIRVDRRQDAGSEPSHLFSTLRLPKITSLPFHLHARFAISANRQDLVFHPANQQNKWDPKSSFNAWILADLVCPLYLASFDHIIRVYPSLIEPKPRAWLVFKSDSDDVSSYLGDSILRHLPGTDLPLFASANRTWLTFKQSVFSYDEPEEIREILGWLEVPSFVDIFRESNIPTLSGSRRVTAAYMVEQLRLPESFLRMEELLNGHASLEGFKYIAALAQYLQTQANLVGLPIIVATTGKLYKVPSISDSSIYISSNAAHADLFPNSVFMQGGYNPRAVAALAGSDLINIYYLTQEWVANIIAVELDTFAKKNESPTQWLRQLWASYYTLPGPPSITNLRLPGLKLIESTQGYISVADCTPQKVVQPPGPEDEWIVPIISALGMNLLRSQERNIFQNYIQETFPSLFINVIECLDRACSATTDPFRGLLDEERHLQLAEWMREHHPTGKERGRLQLQVDSLKPVLLRLPIWEAHYQGRMQIVAASRLKVLPPSISWQSIAPFLISNNYAMTDYSPLMIEALGYSRGFRIEPMTIEEVFDVLELPKGQLQSVEQIQHYKKFLQEFLSCTCVTLWGKLRVPDYDLVLRLPQELFSHEVALFVAALRNTARPSFIHDYFRGLTPQLHELGLQHEINFQNFKACASAVELQGRLIMDTAADPMRLQEIMHMADCVFQYYCWALPAIIGTGSSQWNELDNIAFVHPKSSRREGANYDAKAYCNDLPALLTPSMLLRPEFEPIAWTVRGLFFANPSDHVLAVNRSLGVPGLDQVVDHLRTLSTQVAVRHPGNPHISSDLVSTYEWLNRYAEEARIFLAPLSDVPLFLNVDDVHMDDWNANWISASQLVLNLQFDTPRRKGVREFLQPYRHLLMAAGCLALKLEKPPIRLVAPVTDHTPNLGVTSNERAHNYLHGFPAYNAFPISSAVPAPAPATDGISKLRGIFNEMRSQGEMIDIWLVPNAPLIYNKCDNTIVYNDLGGLPAHKVFLAAVIPYFRTHSQWLNGAQVEFDRSPFAAQAILDFAYTGSFKYPEPESHEDEMNLLREFCGLLHKSHEWDILDLKQDLQQRIIHDHDMVQRLPQGFNLMYATATDARAEALKSALDRFQAANRDILEQFDDDERVEATRQECQAAGDDEVQPMHAARESVSEPVSSRAQGDGSDGVRSFWSYLTL